MPAGAASRCAPAQAPRPGCSGSQASIRTCGAPRRSRWMHGPPSGTGPASGSIIPAMANPAARSSTARSAAGSKKPSRCSSSSARGPQVVIGSSMGGWMALLLAREMARRPAERASLAGLVLIAPAPDFTEELMWKGFSPEARHQIETNGVWLRPSAYGEPYPITRALIEEGRNHLLLGGSIDVGCPVRILQGAQDPGRAMAACLRAGASAAGRRRGADHDPGRRPPPVAAAGHRADDRGGGGDLIAFVEAVLQTQPSSSGTFRGPITSLDRIGRIE